MNRITVDSSNIASIGYDPTTATLEVEFHGGSTYQYFRVPVDVYEALMAAPSKGSFHYHNIRNNYEYQQVG